MASDQFSLHWDNFHNNMSSGMNSLLENEDLVDVTLAVEGKYLKAHKIVLSVCSPYFKELFKVNPCKHPIVFMKDVSYVALSDLLQFMYQGEVQVSQDSLTAFIKTAEALQIKGLTGDNNGSNDNDGETVEKPSPAIPSPSPQSVVQEYKPPVQKQRKIMQSSPVVQPAPKRQRLTSDSQPTPPPITKTEPISSVLTPSSSSTTDQMVQFKMEPYDQSQTINLADDAADDTFGDDHTLDETTMDDTEDYNMMEGGEEEPQAGTSTEVAGEGQASDEDFDWMGLSDQARINKLPEKSRRRYEAIYKKFMEWVEANSENSLSEEVLLAYFEQLSREQKPTSIWAVYSMLRATLILNNGIDLATYPSITGLLKQNSKGYVSKKAKSLKPNEIRDFLEKAPDEKYLFYKVVLIIGVCGGCSRQELRDITPEDIQDTGQSLIIKIPLSQTKYRYMLVPENYYPTCKKYMELRPDSDKKLPFFLKYINGKCNRTIVGVNTLGNIPKKIAQFLNLSDAENYTGHCFRRSVNSVYINDINPHDDIDMVKSEPNEEF